MARLKDILQPGETLILRVPSVWGLWLPALTIFTGLLNALPAISRLAAGTGDYWLDIASAATGLFMVAVGIFMHRLSRIWRFLVTDRRLVKRHETDRSQYEEIPLAELDAVKPYLLGDGLFVVARDGTAIIPCKEKTAGRIRAAVEAAKGAA